MTPGRIALAEFLEGAIPRYPRPAHPLHPFAEIAAYLRFANLRLVTSAPVELVLNELELVPGPSLRGALKSLSSAPVVDSTTVAQALPLLVNAVERDRTAAEHGEFKAPATDGEAPVTESDLARMEAEIDQTLDDSTIRRLHRDEGWSMRRLAREFELSPAGIHKIVHRKGVVV
jgi:hypothetical protein